MDLFELWMHSEKEAFVKMLAISVVGLAASVSSALR